MSSGARLLVLAGPQQELALEQLERRELLATYTVNATTDTGSGSGLTGDLRYCITQVNLDNTTNVIDFAIGGTGTVNLHFTGLAAGTRYLGAVDYSNGTSTIGTTLRQLFTSHTMLR